MKLILTLVCHDRPEYLRTVLESISRNNLERTEILIGLDRATDDVVETITSADWSIPITAAHSDFGVNYANRAIYMEAIRRGADYVCAIEDDTPLAPDCLDMVRWCAERGARFVNCFSPSRDRNRPGEIIQECDFCPWVWAFAPDFLENNILPHWMNDSNGWDWSIKKVIQERGYLGMRPVLSRSGNIGAEGVHYRTEQFNRDFAGHVMSDGNFRNYYLCAS